ncbi:MAG: SIS domain-containing protein [Desulfobacterales bacterium]|nr:SIS domain-containing protein [Desulfobacterales bacterium]
MTGIGKSGLICKKIASTLSSVGVSAIFLHPADSIHGDLGILQKGDVVIVVSNSGESEELIRMLPWIRRMDITNGGHHRRSGIYDRKLRGYSPQRKG